MGNQNKSIYLIPVMLCFFCMGFVDLVGIASNYVKEDLGLTDSVANIFPSLVFFWFLIFSVPTGMLMNKIGRKNTVLLSLIVTVVSLFIPLLGSSFTVMLIAFSLLGIGNAFMQTSINPLAMLIIGDKNLASSSLLTWPCGVPPQLCLRSDTIGACCSSFISLSASWLRHCCGLLLFRKIYRRVSRRRSWIASVCWASPSSCCRSSASCVMWVSMWEPTPLHPSC